jgi:hypothetical protein
MALNNDNNNECCKCTTPEYELILNEQGPQGRQGEKGDAGFTPIISVKDNTPSNYTLNILTQDGQITTPNLKANLPAGGATGQVLTKNSGEQDDCSWQNLPASTIETEGIARLATEADFETTEDTEASDNTIVTPALFNSEFKKQSAKFVTTNTQQNINASKTFWNGINVYNNLSIPYNSSSQNGKIVTNANVDNVRIPIIEPYDTNGSFRIGAVKEEASINIQNGFDINNNIIDGLQGVTYYEQGQKGKLIADFNIDKYVKAGDNITIDITSNGLTINSTGGGEVPDNVAILTEDQTFTGHNYFNGQVNFNGTVQFTNQQVNIPKLYSSNTITGTNITLDSVGKSYKFPCQKGTLSLSATSGDEAGTKAGLYINGAGIDNKRLLTEDDLSSGGFTLASAPSSGIAVFGQKAKEIRMYGTYVHYADNDVAIGTILDTGNFATLAPTGALKYWTGTEANYTAIETKNADTLYRTTDTNKVYLGTIQIGGGS